MPASDPTVYLPPVGNNYGSSLQNTILLNTNLLANFVVFFYFFGSNNFIIVLSVVSPLFMLAKSVLIIVFIIYFIIKLTVSFSQNLLACWELDRLQGEDLS